MPASLYQSNFNLERISATEMDHRDSAVKLAMELANLCSFSNMSELEAGPGGQSCLSDHFSLGSGQTLAQISEELKAKKSQNMTECVPVPSSEHVAEIVGRQGEYSNHRVHSRQSRGWGRLVDTFNKDEEVARGCLYSKY